jgi:hypothetical protein
MEEEYLKEQVYSYGIRNTHLKKTSAYIIISETYTVKRTPTIQYVKAEESARFYICFGYDNVALPTALAAIRTQPFRTVRLEQRGYLFLGLSYRRLYNFKVFYKL